MGGRLEHEIRLLPQVLSCSFSKDDYVVVLIEPSADPHAIRGAVERILQTAGSGATVRVIGPAEPVEVAATRVVSPLVATATVATVAAIGVGALVGGLAATHGQPAKPPVPEIRPAGAAITPLDSIDLLRGVQVSAAAPAAPNAFQAQAPDLVFRSFPISYGTAVEAVSLSRAIPPLHRGTAKQESESFDTHHESARSHGAHRQGNGPPSWSHSHSGSHEKDEGRG